MWLPWTVQTHVPETCHPLMPQQHGQTAYHCQPRTWRNMPTQRLAAGGGQQGMSCLRKARSQDTSRKVGSWLMLDRVLQAPCATSKYVQLTVMRIRIVSAKHRNNRTDKVRAAVWYHPTFSRCVLGPCGSYYATKLYHEEHHTSPGLPHIGTHVNTISQAPCNVLISCSAGDSHHTLTCSWHHVMQRQDSRHHITPAKTPEACNREDNKHCHQACTAKRWLPVSEMLANNAT